MALTNLANSGDFVISSTAKDALTTIFNYTISVRTPGTAAAANYYGNIGQIADIRKFLAACSPQFGSEWRKQRTIDMLTLYHGVEAPVALDVGSGPGISASVIRECLKPRQLVLVDLFPEALELAKSSFSSKPPNDNCVLEYKTGRAERLQDISELPRADLVFMRSLLRYVRSSDYGAVFRGVYHVLKPGGYVIFDLPLKSKGEWLSEEDSPFAFLADTLHGLFSIPPLVEVVEGSRRYSPVSIAELVGRELKLAGFKGIEAKHFSRSLSLKEGAQMALLAIGDIFDGLRFLNEKAYHEVGAFAVQIGDALNSRLSAKFSGNGVYVGLTALKAFK